MRLTAEAGGTGALTWAWTCACVFCGAERHIIENRLIYKPPQSCGCQTAAITSERYRAAAQAQYVGKTFGWLTVTGIESSRDSGRAGRNLLFTAACKCGSSEPKTGALGNLLTGRVSTCCDPAPFTAASERLLLEVLAQLRAGAEHLRKHRIALEVLPRAGLFDAKAWAITPAGQAALASGRIDGYLTEAARRR